MPKPYIEEIIDRLDLKCDMIESQKRIPKSADIKALIGLARYVVEDYRRKNAVGSELNNK